jgi:nitrogen regulatory protein PII
MHQETRKLLTVITEAALESALCEELIQLGASGYTVTNARGRGSRGVRDAGWSSSGNIRIEVVCDKGIAEKIAARLRDKYYSDYAMILFLSDVSVLRPKKF